MGAHPGHADKSKPVESKGWGVHPRSWPSDKGLQGKHADKGKPVEGKGKGGEPEHKPNAKGSAQWKPTSGKQTGAEQASKSDTSGTSENKSEENQDKNEKDAISASKEEEDQAKRHTTRRLTLWAKVPRSCTWVTMCPSHTGCVASPRRSCGGTSPDWLSSGRTGATT